VSRPPLHGNLSTCPAQCGAVPPIASRVAGRGRLLRQLAALSRRVDRFSAHRASSDAERRWAALLADQLDSAYAAAIAAPGAHAALAAVWMPMVDDVRDTGIPRDGAGRAFTEASLGEDLPA